MAQEQEHTIIGALLTIKTHQDRQQKKQKNVKERVISEVLDCLPIIMSSQLTQVGAGDVPHVDGRVVAGGQEDPAGQGDADTGEAGLG